MDDELYRQNILEHYRNPSNAGILKSYNVSKKGTNPTCGDAFTLYASLKDGLLDGVSFDGDGCAISIASSSMFLDAVRGFEIDKVQKLTPEYVYDMLGVKVNPARENCALLAFWTLQDMLKNYV